MLKISIRCCSLQRTSSTVVSEGDITIMSSIYFSIRTPTLIIVSQRDLGRKQQSRNKTNLSLTKDNFCCHFSPLGPVRKHNLFYSKTTMTSTIFIDDSIGAIGLSLQGLQVRGLEQQQPKNMYSVENVGQANLYVINPRFFSNARSFSCLP